MLWQGLSVFREFVNVLSSYMAPGNLKCEFMGKLENKPTSNRLLSARKNNTRNNALHSDMANSNQPNHHHVVVDAMGTTTNAASDQQQTIHAAEASDDRMHNLDVGNCGDKSKLEPQITHLKGLLMLHLDLIQQQQKDLQQKDKEIQKLRDDKETLLCRLQRMERRMSLANKSGPPKNKNCSTNQTIPSTPSKTETPNKRKVNASTPSSSKKTQLEIPEPKSPSRSVSPSKLSKDAHLTTPAKTRRYRRHRKYKELSEDKFHRTKILYPSLRDLRIAVDDDLPLDSGYVVVPTWRVSHVSNTSLDESRCEEMEEINDKIVEIRHHKMEMDEKKRKRWDVQRIRQIREHERLEMKLMEREIANREDVIETFEPDVDDILRIEVRDTVPVMAFGMLVPTITESEFKLPWYTPEPKAGDEQRRQTRSRAGKK
ncbi:male-specific lethal 1-like 1 [Anneissia japonica]|uniref:male-specific lethal 1-like 1 n=1 Tax=Anneissia japonica TaxID=1529436 RepID=UPI0014257E21|nr:male-specific lethal 1-like 1 [Anneissia japonica]